jgi:putative Holliday junction resolvase
MSRILAIDYGTKRIGLAVTDPQGIIANVLDTVPSHEVMAYLQNYIQKENVKCFVLGDPKSLNDSDSDTSKHVYIFANALKKKFPQIPVHLMDERFTSLIAQRSLIQSGQSRKTRRDKSVLDKVSATLLLQSYLEQQQHRNIL